MEPNDFGVRCDILLFQAQEISPFRGLTAAPVEMTLCLVISSGANEVSEVEKSLTVEIPPLRRFAPTVGMTMGGPCGHFDRK